MKLTILLLTVFFCNLNANTTYGQKTKISLNVSDVTIQNVLDTIESLTDYKFLVNVEEINIDEKISVNANKLTINRILKKIFQNRNVGIKIVDNQIVLGTSRNFPTRMTAAVKTTDDQLLITGTVTDKEGAVLPGASIVEKGTTNGSQTDFDGNFTLEVADQNAILIVSYIGFITLEVPISEQTDLNIVLQADVAGLDEVVVMGYGTQIMKEVTGAVSAIHGDKLDAVPVATLSNALTGRLSGLTVANGTAEPGHENSNILIRGLSSTTNQSPLIVIDGIASADGIDRIDPNDVASISVLKDASAAIYGARSAGGVILITTKRGTAGKPVFSFTSNLGVNSPISLPKMSNASQFMRLRNLTQYYGSNWDPNYSPLFTDAQIADAENGVTPSYDWSDFAYKDRFTQQMNNFSVKGGNEKVKYFTSFRYLTQGTLFEGDDVGGNKQYNLRSNIDFMLSERLNIGLDISGRQQDRSIAALRDRIYANTQLTIPIQPFFINDDPRYPTTGRATQNPYTIIRNSGYDSDEINVYGTTLKFDYQIPSIVGLSLKGFTSVNIATNYNKRFQTPYPYYQLDGNNEIEEIMVGTSSILTENYSRRRQMTYNLGTTYLRSFDDHNFDVLLQVEQQQIRLDGYTGFNDLFLSQSLDIFDAGSPNRASSGVEGSAKEAARLNYSGRLNYNFKDRYLAQFLFRYDGTEVFGPGKRFGFFPGVSLGWVVSDEDFFNIDSFSFVKLRASWGELGNDGIDQFQFLQRYIFDGNTVVDGVTTAGVEPSGEPNPNVTWETTETLNFGFDVKLFHNHLSLSADYFINTTNDILLSPNLNIPAYTGIRVDQIKQNIGTMENKGYEFSANYIGNIGNDFNFSIGGNMSFVRNKVINIQEARNPDAPWQDQTGKPLATVDENTGEINPVFYYETVGIFKTQSQLDDNSIPRRIGTQLGNAIIKDINKDGVIDGLDRVRAKKTGIPELSYGITGSANYKDFDFNMLWQGASGNIRTLETTTGGTENSLAWFANNTWSPDNPDANFPAFNRDLDTDFYQLDRSYLRLKTIELGYTLPNQAVSGIGISNLRLYFSGYNLITFDKLSDMGFTDPEQNHNFGWDFPNLKTFNVGINIVF